MLPQGLPTGSPFCCPAGPKRRLSLSNAAGLGSATAYLVRHPMRALALLLALTAAALSRADLATSKALKPMPVDLKPLPNEKTKLPWHMVNLWWTIPETPDFESLEIDVTISEDVDPAKLNLYIAPIGLGQLNETNFYGGIQTNIGGNAEVEAARWIKEHCRKPVAGFIAGATAPAGRRMGHAGAVIGGAEDTAAAKIKIFHECGISVAATPSDMADALLRIWKG